MDQPSMVSLSLNGVEWIPLGLFTYFEPEVDWIGYPPQFTDIAVNFKK